MRTIIFPALLVILLVCPFNTHAELKIQPGEYITEGGWGNLKIKQDEKGRLSFEIEAVGGNAHTCTLSGEIIGQKSVLKEREQSEPCIVTFTPTKEGIKVTENDGACEAAYCGARAHFVYLYLRPTPICAPDAIRKTRDEFKKLYDKKAYAQARAKLETVIGSCSDILDWWASGWIRNDLAITMYKLGDHSSCLDVLQPLQEDADESDENVRSKYGPMVADSAMQLVKATRANLKLCKRIP